MYKGSSESAHVKIPHCLKSHVTAHIILRCVFTYLLPGCPRRLCRISILCAQSTSTSLKSSCIEVPSGDYKIVLSIKSFLHVGFISLYNMHFISRKI